jgi:23S rRNA pseudouridine1911/1915/1917 synthase
VNAKVLEATVPGEAPARLDVFLAGQFPEFSRSRIQQLIHAGLVRVDGNPAEKSGQTILAGQQICMEIPPLVTSALTGEKIELRVIFENENVLVIDKPAGMVVHPSYGHGSGTLVNAVLGMEGELPQINGEFRPGIVHRLDKETSGLILIAKNDRSLQFLQDQFKTRQVEKIYQTLVDGCPPTPLGRVEAHIGRDPKNRKKMAITDPASGREAITEYRTLESFKRHTYLEIHPLTGRTHQIRVHMKFLGCPVTGDTVYGYKKPSINLHRHFLHASRLKIRLPGEDAPRVFITPLPVELQRTLDDLR